MERRRVGILGATGMVGQRFIQLLNNHPWFEITWLAASDRSAGKTYGEACRWKLDTPLPAHIAQMTVMPNVPEGTPRASCRRSSSPRWTPTSRGAGAEVRRGRLRGDLELQRLPHDRGRAAGGAGGQCRPPGADRAAELAARDSGGYIVTNPNCCAIGLVLALKPLEERFGIESLFVSTMQAVSGAGYPGVASLDILGNVVPFIKNEEEKLQEEVGKLLGRFTGDAGPTCWTRRSARTATASPSKTATPSASASSSSSKATREEVLAAWSEFAPLRGSAPAHRAGAAGRVRRGVDRPQPRLDRMRGNGMATTVGRLRECSLLDWKFVVLSHNTIRGAAGAAVLNAEVLARLGKLDGKKRRARSGDRRCWHERRGRQRRCGADLVVMKFGGTSVEDAEAMLRTAAIVRGRRERGL